MHNNLQPYSNFSSAARWRSRRIYLVGALGTIIEWYDFYLYICFAQFFATIFFANQKDSILLVYAVFFISYLSRPIGGLFYGWLGDSWGRKRALLFSIFIMCLCMFTMALLPSQHKIGGFAPIFLIIFRIIQGLSVGGETAGSLVYVLESVENRHQGIYGASTLSMSWLGSMLAIIVAVLLMHSLSHAQLLVWGWRLAYVVGGLAGLAIFIVRMTIPESLEFYTEQQRLTKVHQSNKYRASLFKTVLANHKRVVLQIIVLFAINGGLGSFIYNYVSIYLYQYFSIHLVTGWSLQIIVDIFTMLCLILSGFLSDHLPKNRLPTISAFGFLFFSYPLLSLLSPGQWHMAALVLMLFSINLSLYEGPLPALLIRLAPLQVRYTVFALGYNVAFAVFAGSSPLICATLAKISPKAPAFYFMVLASLALIVLYFIGKRRAIEGKSKPMAAPHSSDESMLQTN